MLLYTTPLASLVILVSCQGLLLGKVSILLLNLVLVSGSLEILRLFERKLYFLLFLFAATTVSFFVGSFTLLLNARGYIEMPKGLYLSQLVPFLERSGCNNYIVHCEVSCGLTYEHLLLLLIIVTVFNGVWV